MPDEAYNNLERQVMFLVHDLEPAFASFKTLLRLVRNGKYDSTNPLHKNLAASCDWAMSFSQTLLQDMLEFEKMRLKGISCHPERINWREFLDNALFLPRNIASEKDIRIISEISDPEPETVTDPRLLTRIICNLLVNAVKNSPNKTRIWLRVRMGHPKTNIDVIDEGPGVPKSKLNEIFNKNFQYEGENHRAYRGIGLGLTFCREACALLKGSIRVSRRKPHGMRFRVSLP